MKKKPAVTPPPRGTKVYLSVYPTKGEDYGGEWDTDTKGAINAARDWMIEDKAFIVEAIIVRIVATLHPKVSGKEPRLEMEDPLSPMNFDPKLLERLKKLNFTDRDGKPEPPIELKLQCEHNKDKACNPCGKPRCVLCELCDWCKKGKKNGPAKPKRARPRARQKPGGDKGRKPKSRGR